VHILYRAIRFLLSALAALAVVVPAWAADEAVPPTWTGTGDCAKAIVDDWYPDARVDFLYPIACYTDAIKGLPNDLRDYTQAPDDIDRALQFAKRNEADPGRGGAGKPPTGTTETTDTGPKPGDPTDTGGFGSVGGDAGGPDAGSGEQPDPGAGSADSSSVPVPLIVLGGLAVLLFAAGGAGYLSRRMRDQSPPEEDPASAP